MRILLFVVVIFVSLTACKNQEKPEVKTITAEQSHDIATNYVTAEFTIEGMSCAIGCAGAIEKNLTAMKGVKVAKVNFEEKRAVVEYDNNHISPQDIERKVVATGDGSTYKVMNMTKSKK